ncbi:MAG: hypothetical protein ACJAVH_002001 [Bacteroidia bacterium]|jgi:hypothetical protein
MFGGMLNYDNIKFKVVSVSNSGEVSGDTVFYYRQKGNVVTCSYNGENIEAGHLLGVVDEKGCIDMKYHQVNKSGEIMTGVCKSTPELIEGGKVRLHEEWQWTGLVAWINFRSQKS